MNIELFDESFDNKTPIEKYNELCFSLEQSQKILNNKILIFFFLLDKLIKENFNTQYSYYIFSDDCIYDCFAQMGENITKETFLISHIILDYTKFLYRFTCAKKFEIENASTKQLRINSWGKAYCEILLAEKLYIDFAKKASAFIKGCFQSNHSKYQEILNYLFPLNSQKLSDIKEINAELFIKLLS